MEIASMRRRALATFVDGIVGGVVFLGATAAVSFTLHRIGSSVRASQFMRAPAYRRTLTVLTLLARVGLRNVPTVGMRLTGIRRVAAHSGGPVSLRRAVARALFGVAWQWPVRRLLAPMRERHEAKGKAVQADIREAHRRDPDDREAQRRVMQADTDNGYSQLSSCAPGLVPLAIETLPMWFTERHQPLSDWVAGIAVIRD